MRIKVLPEDFKVKEEINLKIKNKGFYAYFLLIKKNRNTIDVLKEIAKKAKLKNKYIGFAGIKDKKAITEQYISIPASKAEFINKIKLKNASLRFEGLGDEKVYTGKLAANHFDIIVRDIEHKLAPVDQMPNYFGEQRFGISNRNIKTGKLLVKKKFKEVCEHLNLKPKGKDYINAIRMHGEDMIKFYIHAYQSKLFNDCLTEYIMLNDNQAKKIKTPFGAIAFPSPKNIKKIENIKIALINFSTDISNKQVEDIYSRILEREGITKMDFLIRQLPRTISLDDDRSAFVNVKNLRMGRLSYDEISNRKKQKVSFSLPKGSYATILLRQMALA